jgi:hypothetical protein
MDDIFGFFGGEKHDYFLQMIERNYVLHPENGTVPLGTFLMDLKVDLELDIYTR